MKSPAPNFFIVGAPKCGTTALASYLKQHPQVFFCEPKEPHYFSTDFKNRFVDELDQYLALFAAAESTHLAIGEGSTTYLRSEAAIPEIARRFSDARFIVMLRNPVDLVQSYHAEMIREGQEDMFDFEEAWRLAESRRRGSAVPATCRDPKLLDYPRFGLLGEQLRRAYSYVSSDRLKVVFFDDFVTSTAQVYRSILAFLSLPDDGRTEFAPVNSGQTLRSVRLQHMILRLGDLKQKLGLRHGLGVYKRLRPLLFTSRKRPALSAKFLLELEDFFREDVYELMRVTGRDLSSWLPMTIGKQ